ncbi:hypothetical protein [Paenibacillus daejeonensis]|uniref:hypothetical protein n=1 Tax=Paenibacillus daejeonensis TaxID=135193 RepID=UPI00037B9F7E|nr:hypothetical protein [Paenibacillus daejeonensis]
MPQELKLSDKEARFVDRWSAVRNKGKMRYIIMRGIIGGLLLFAIWFVVTLIEIRFSEFQSALFTWPDFMRRSLIWLVVYQLIGFTLAASAWKGQERKYDYLT